MKISFFFLQISFNHNKTVERLAFAKWSSPSERKQFQQAFAESKIFESYSSKPEPKQWLVEQLYIEHFQFWKQATKHKSSII